ncbi:MAG: YbaB/EbfC family nucleoid-associated protein [Clostridia bacterium]
MARGGFPRGMNMGGANMNNMLRQAQKMQEEMLKTQEELGEKTVDASVGGGAVAVVVNGKKELVSITIKPEAVDPEDVEMLQDLIVSAVNEAMRKADDMVSSSMSKITGGMNIPGLF